MRVPVSPKPPNIMRYSPARQRDDGVDDLLPRPKSIWEEYVGQQPMPSPRIHDQRTPQSRPRHRPYPTDPPSNSPPCRPRKRDLYDHADTHKKEEPSNRDKFRPIPYPPHGNVMNDGGNGKCTHDGARLSEEDSTGTGAKRDEKGSKKLVPAEVPKILKGGGHPRLVKERRGRGLGGWLAKNNSSEQC